MQYLLMNVLLSPLRCQVGRAFGGQGDGEAPGRSDRPQGGGVYRRFGGSLGDSMRGAPGESRGRAPRQIPGLLAGLVGRSEWP